MAWTTTGVALCFFIFGYCDAIRGAALPEIRTSFSMSYRMGGFSVVLHYIGYCSASLVFGACTGRISRRVAATIANVILAAGVAVYIIAGNLLVLLAAMLMIGFALGGYEYIGNSVIVDIYDENHRGKFANLVAGSHAVGAILAPVIYGRILEQGGGFRISFWLLLPVPCLVALLFLFSQYPSVTYLKDRPVGVRDVFRAFARRDAAPYFVMAVAYIAAESGVLTWVVSYLQDVQGYDSASAANCLSLFFLFYTAGRLAGSMFVDRLGCIRVLRTSFLGSALCVAAALLNASTCVFFFVLSGTLMSVAFPTLGAALSMTCKKDTSVVMGAFYCCAALGGAIGSWIVGQISQQVNPAAGISTAVVFNLISFAAAMKVKYQKEQVEASQGVES